MSRRSASRLLALSVVVAEVILGVVLFARLPAGIRSSLDPLSATAAPPGTLTPAPHTTVVGTYWTCESNVSDNGTVSPNARPPAGGVRSPLCDDNYGRLGPGRPQPELPARIKIWRVPVGTFTPYKHCGVTVMNIVDPYDPQAAPETWPRDHEVLLAANWTRIQPGNC